MAKGLTLTLYKHPRYVGCAAGGISERVDEVTVVGIRDETAGQPRPQMSPLPKHSQVFEPKPESPAAVLVKRHIGRIVWHVEPVTEDGEVHWFSSGGSYAASCDSRIGDIIGFYGALTLHDRQEW